MEPITWGIVIIMLALSFLLIIFAYGLGHRRGYMKGSMRVLAEWKETLRHTDEMNDI